MIKKIGIIFLIFLAFLFPIASCANDITITIVYNNVPYNEDLTTAWGMSCLIEGLEKTILFDTGGVGSILLSNMRKLKIAPQDVEVIILSHIHWDHVGGLWTFLEENSDVTVYLPQSFPKSFKDKAMRICEEAVLVDRPMEVCKDVWTTGQLGTWMKEQSLIVDTEKGLIVITGCAHPGVVNITRFAEDMFKKEVYLVLGGFHLLAYSEDQVKKIIKGLKGLGVRKVGPSHCTGGRPIELFRKAWGKDFFDLGCGSRIKIDGETYQQRGRWW